MPFATSEHIIIIAYNYFMHCIMITPTYYHDGSVLWLYSWTVSWLLMHCIMITHALYHDYSYTVSWLLMHCIMITHALYHKYSQT
jgi:hypothetical protein